MNELKIFQRNGQFVADSREVAEMTGKLHKNLLRDIDGYFEILKKSTSPNLSPLDFFIPATYQDSKGETRRRYDITRKGCDMVANKMTGEKGVLFTAMYVTKFDEMERKLAQPTNLENLLLNPDTIIKLAQNWKEEQEKRIKAEQQIEADKPKVVFAEAFITSDDLILVRDFAKILNQNGINIGQNRLFIYLREKGYLIKQKGSDWNMPTQKSMDLGLFEIKDTLVHHNSGRVTVSKTPKLTTKGQFYFINHFKKQIVSSEKGGEPFAVR